MKAVLSQIGIVIFLSFSSASENTDMSNFLRGNDVVERRKVAADTTHDRKLNAMFCGCVGCDDAALNVFAGEYKCGDRINYLQSFKGFSERDACTIAGTEFPEECGVCDPDVCNQEPEVPSPPPPSSGKCGCPECEDVWNVIAREYSCGVRIEWLQSEFSTIAGGPYDERVACSKVASEEFPNECGKCDPSRCNGLPTAEPTRSPTETPTRAPIKTPTETPVDSNNNEVCGCATCDDSVWNTFAGAYKCGDRIEYIKNSEGLNERGACSKVAGLEFPVECGGCDPDRCVGNNNNNNNNAPSGQKCGGAVNSSSDSSSVCQMDLWDPTGDSTMHCFAYGGSGDPCHLSNTNDPDDGRFKNPSACIGDTFYLWDEPDTQGKSYDWAGRTWLEYSRRFPNELRELKARGAKISSPLLKAGGPGVLTENMREFLASCGSACTDEWDPAYVDVIAINAFCGDFNGPSGCRGGASFIYNEALATSNAFGNVPVYITNWSRLQTSNPQDQVDAVNAIDAFFPSSAASNPVIERVYWFGATDFGGGSSNNFLTQVLADGSTLGEVWREKCDSL